MNLLRELQWPERFQGNANEFRAALSRYRLNDEYGTRGNYAQYDGYARMAEEVFGGDMGKAHDAITQMNLLKELKWPGRFDGTAKEFKAALSRYRLNDQYGTRGNYGQLDGYARMAEEVFNGDMGKAHDAITQMNLLKELKWPGRFDGTAKEFKAALSRYRLNDQYGTRGNYGQLDGYARMAEEVFNGDMARAHDAITEMNLLSGLEWPAARFDGTAREFKAALSRYRANDEYGTRGNFSGSDGYARLAREVFEGDLAVTYDRMEEIVGASGIRNLGWSRVPPRNGPKPPPQDVSVRAQAKELKELREALFSGTGTEARPRSTYTGVEGQLKWADNKYKGDTQLAYREATAKLSPQEVSSLGWSPQVQVPVQKARAILRELPGSGFFSKNGFKSKYRGGAGLKLVAKEYFDGDTVAAITTGKALFGDKFSGLDW